MLNREQFEQASSLIEAAARQSGAVQGLLDTVFSGASARPDLDLSGAPRVVAQRVVQALKDFLLEDRSNALGALLELRIPQVGADDQAAIRALQAVLRTPGLRITTANTAAGGPPHVFISYAHANLDFVTRFVADLRGEGLRVWIDQTGLPPGTPNWDNAIREAIEGCRALLLIASPQARRSDYVADELAYAQIRARRIIPIWAAGEEWIDCIPLGMGKAQYIDARHESYREGLQTLLAALREDGETLVSSHPRTLIPDEGEEEALGGFALAEVTPARKPRQIPGNRANFVGRADLLGQIGKYLEAKTGIVLRGMGGIGKTALAAGAASAYLSAGANRLVVWVGVEGARTRAILRAIAVKLQSTEMLQAGDALDEQIDALAEALENRAALLVLDSVRDPRVIVQIMEALTADVPVLATTRSAPAVPGVRVIRVPELNAEEALGVLRLYTDRLDDTEAAPLCETLGFHPLALHVAGGWMQQYEQTPAYIRAQVSESPVARLRRDLDQDSGRTPLEMSLDQSVTLLDGDLRRAFAAFGLMVAPAASLELLAGTLNLDPGSDRGVEAARRLLTRLDSFSLAWLPVAAADQMTHYRIHNLTHDYARQMARGDSRAGLIAAARAMTALYTDQPERLHLDMPNILGAALGAHRADQDSALIAIIRTLVPHNGYIDRFGHTAQMVECLDLAIAACRTGESDTETLHFLLSKRGDIHNLLGEFDSALNCLREAFAVAPNTQRQAVLTSVIGMTHTRIKDFVQAERYFDQAETLAIGDPLALSLVYGHRGTTAFFAQEAAKARDYFERSRAQAEMLAGAERSLSLYFPTYMLGGLDEEADALDSALTLHHEALRLAETTGQKRLIGDATWAIGYDRHRRGQRAEAEPLMKSALRLYLECGALADARYAVGIMTEQGYLQPGQYSESE